jgi:CheY-like chemotaxis protein
MIDSRPTHPPENPPDSFVAEVKDALEHLYDLSYLQHHPLVQESGLTARHPIEISAQRLRRELATAIEALDPGDDVLFHAPSARQYHLLTLHYMQNMTVQEVARELRVSVRQAYRGLRQAERSVAEVMWAKRPSQNLQEEHGITPLASLQKEVARLEVQPRPTSLYLLLQSAIDVVEPLAEQRGVLLDLTPEEESVTIPVRPAVVEQLLVGILSHAVSQAQAGSLRLALAGDDTQTYLTFCYTPDPKATDSRVINQTVVAQLTNQLGWSASQKDEPEGQRTITLHAATSRPTVLIIDDNEGLIELLERYLASQACRIITAVSGQEGLQYAREKVPDAIVLDVMMPGMHGWKVLQGLRSNPGTRDIPVIVCSVITFPDLAYSLGASLFLSKPIDQDDILEALNQVGVL